MAASRPSPGGIADELKQAPPPTSDDRDRLSLLHEIQMRRDVEAERANIAREHAALAARLISAQDEERQRIARDLHDNIGQQVTALRLMLQVIAMGDVDDVVRARVAQAQSIVEQLDRQLDFMSGELRPASVHLGIALAIEQFASDWSATFGIPAEVQHHGLEQLRLNPDVETHLYRVAQEALNNVYKHAHARHVRVTLRRQQTDVALIVTDDGRGFDAEPLSGHHGRGLGLAGMRERAQIIGGTIDIETAPGKGTTISLRVPIADRRESR